MEVQLRPNGEADPNRVHVGRHFTVNWAFITEAATIRCYVYEVYDASHTLLYVGITDGFPGRWSAHLSKSWWTREATVDYVILTGYESRSAARKVEATLIHDRAPIYNTKPEWKFLRLARSTGLPDDSLIAELLPTGWGGR